VYISLATLAVACSVAYVALKQWRLAQHRFRLDLFDRRYKVYDAAKKFLSLGQFDDPQLFEFNAGTADAEFLFDSRITEYLQEVRKRAVNVQTHEKIYEHMPVGEERSRHVEAAHKDRLWLTQQIPDMTNVFMPYLSFSRIK
jgi:hypothetical protein